MACIACGCGRLGFDGVLGGDGGGGPTASDPVLYFSCDAPVVAGVLTDDSGNGNDGSCVDCPSTEAGRVGQACAFDDVDDDHVLIPSGPGLEDPAALTLALWVNLDAGDDYYSLLSKPFGGGNENTWQLEVTLDCGGGDPRLAFITSSFTRSCHDQDPPTGVWLHLAGVWDGTDQRFFIDGVQVDETNNGDLDFDGAEIVLGADYNSGSLFNQTEGRIDEIYIFDRALAGDEIATLANP